MTKAREIAELGQKLTVDGSGNIEVAGNVTSDGLDVDGDVTLDPTSNFVTITGGTNDNNASGITLRPNWGNTSDGKLANELRFQGADDNTTNAYDTFATIQGLTTNWTADSNIGGRLIFNVRYNNASKNALDLRETESVFNNGSNDRDFRVESNDNSALFFVDGGTNRVGINTQSPAKMLHLSQSTLAEMRIQNSTNSYALDLGVNGTVGQVKASADLALMPGGIEKWRIDSSGNVTQTNTGTGAGAGPYFNLYRNSSSPANGDSLGIIQFNGEDSAGNTTNYASIASEARNVTDGNEDGLIVLKTMKNGTNTSRMVFREQETNVNDNSADLDFRVESGTQSHMLFVDAANDKVGIATVPSSRLHIKDTNTSTGSTNPPHLRIEGNNGLFYDIGRDNAGTGFLSFYGNQLNANGYIFGGANGERMRINADGTMIHQQGAVFNEAITSQDFRVESDASTHAIYVDAADNKISLGRATYSSDMPALVSVSNGSGSTAGRNSLDEVYLGLGHNEWTNGGGAHFGIGFGYKGAYSHHPTIIAAKMNSSSGGTNNNLIFYNRKATSGTPEERLRFTPNDGAVFNEDGHDYDFRVESDNETHALFVEAGEDRVGINHANPSYTLHVGDQNAENMGIGWMRMELFTVGIPSSGTRWYKIANYSTGIMLQGQLFMSAARNGGANQTNGARIQHGSLAGYNNAVNTSDWGDLGTNYGHTAYYVEVGTDTHVYLRVNGSVYGGEVYCMFQGRANWQFDGTYVTSAP